MRGVVVDERGRLLCVRLKAYGGRSERTFWCLPGGGIDSNETLFDAIKREMIEETAITPVIGELLYVHQFAFEGKEQFEFFFHITNTDDYKNIDLSAATHAEEEIAELAFADPKAIYILPEFLATENLTQHICDKVPAKLFSYL